MCLGHLLLSVTALKYLESYPEHQPCFNASPLFRLILASRLPSERSCGSGICVDSRLSEGSEVFPNPMEPTRFSQVIGECRLLHL